MNSYLLPIVKELSKLNRKPLLVKRHLENIAVSRVTTLYVSGDGVQCNELMNFAGHCSRHGCRFCLTRGEHRVDVGSTNAKHGMYFQQRNQEIRSRDSLVLKDKSPQYVSKLYITYKIVPNFFFLPADK